MDFQIIVASFSMIMCNSLGYKDCKTKETDSMWTHMFDYQVAEYAAISDSSKNIAKATKILT
ncbi:MAG: hypothetical protein CMQ41_16240 [Gammaproteobacteria bacterium]|nr:hypothetical protein [Gammaproteobacteria bacterium]